MIAVGDPLHIGRDPKVVGRIVSVDETGHRIGMVITDDDAKLEFALRPSRLRIGKADLTITEAT
ncbi:hypothetical protein MRBLMI12_000480 [Microbacterium sp. LMI12-1-1.1]|uniref:hypothetical protein n=1 Tax=Microbacterium sp. LMI12-1-1.1 TaxID=3135225 RepID=UPI003425F3DE